jgi:hypothetical protein
LEQVREFERTGVVSERLTFNVLSMSTISRHAGTDLLASVFVLRHEATIERLDALTPYYQRVRPLAPNYINNGEYKIARDPVRRR